MEGVLRPSNCWLEGWLDLLAVQLLQGEGDMLRAGYKAENRGHKQLSHFQDV